MELWFVQRDVVGSRTNVLFRQWCLIEIHERMSPLKRFRWFMYIWFNRNGMVSWGNDRWFGQRWLVEGRMVCLKRHGWFSDEWLDKKTIAVVSQITRSKFGWGKYGWPTKWTLCKGCIFGRNGWFKEGLSGKYHVSIHTDHHKYMHTMKLYKWNAHCMQCRPLPYNMKMLTRNNYKTSRLCYAIKRIEFPLVFTFVVEKGRYVYE